MINEVENNEMRQNGSKNKIKMNESYRFFKIDRFIGCARCMMIKCAIFNTSDFVYLRSIIFL